MQFSYAITTWLIGIGNTGYGTGLYQQPYRNGITEISSLGNSFNRMFQQIQESFETLEHRVEQRLGRMMHWFGVLLR